MGPAFVSAFFHFFSRVLGLLRLLFMHYSWTVAAKFDLSNNFQPISAHRALFTDPQISLFNNFFIKNGSYGTIHTFKNYFATVFFSFQFSAISKRTLNALLVPTFWFFFHFSPYILFLPLLVSKSIYEFHLSPWSYLPSLI